MFKMLRMLKIAFITFVASPITVMAADCILVIPQFPLSYNGLLTPYRLQSVNMADKCLMENPQTTSFVEATIFDPDTGKLSVYHPLVVNDGQTPLIPPTTFTMPANAIISLSFGTNANTLRLTPPENVIMGRCVNGVVGNNDLFGQFSYCNSDALFDKVNEWIGKGLELNPPIPPIGVANDGKECLTTRHFMLVDQDPSDNLVTTYLLDPVTMKIFQDTVNNRFNHPGFVVLKNGSDNRLLVGINIALGCTGYLAPLLSDPSGAKTSSMVLNEIHAANRQGSPMVFLPARDPMTRVIVNGVTFPSLIKNNLYRRGINQPPITALQQADTLPFCGHLTNQLGRLQNNKASFTTQTSPDPNAASNLFTFLATRLSQTFANLKCDVLLDLINPVTLVLANGITVDATFSALQEYQFMGQDPYVSPTSPTSSPTSPPTSPPPPTTPPTSPPTVAPTGDNNMINIAYIYISIGSLVVLVIILYYIKKRCEKSYNNENNGNNKNNEKNNDENNKNINDPILCRDSFREVRYEDKHKNYRISSPRVPKR
jgi:hypothetical protein